MSRSKASAALERLKEFDKKYKLKGERKKSESSEGTTEEGIRSKLDIRIPDPPVVVSARGTTPRKSGSFASESPRARSSSAASSLAQGNGSARKSESEISTHEDEDISDPSTSITASSSEEKISRSYRSDTFEDASSSSIKSRGSNSERESAVRAVEPVEASRPGKQLIELVGPKPVQSVSECEIGLDQELSDYVKLVEALEEDSAEIGPISLLKSSGKHVEPAATDKPTKPTKPKQRQPTSSVEELYNNETLIESQSNQGSIVEAVDRPVEKAEDSNVAVAGNENMLEPKSADNSERVEEVEPEESIDLLKENPEDEANATQVLRQLNREAINAIIKRHRVTEKPNSPRKTSSVEEDNWPASSRRCKSKRKQHSRTNKRFTNSRLRDEKVKADKVDSKESTDAQRRRLIAARLQREREDLGAFRQELDNIHLLNGSHPIPKAPLIKPLELPNIQSYQRSDDSDSPLLKPITDIERLGEKLAEIQYWLKDQYTLYREYSKLARIMNARYVPSNLQDAKEMIQDLKTRTSKITTQVN